MQKFNFLLFSSFQLKCFFLFIAKKKVFVYNKERKARYGGIKC